MIGLINGLAKIKAWKDNPDKVEKEASGLQIWIHELKRRKEE
jgi:hypothetical protein